jgi:hypothetical protein
VSFPVRRKESSIPRDPLSEVASLSLTARRGVALHLFAGYCRRRGLDHPELTRYIEHIWGFAALPRGGFGFEEWEFGRPALVDTGLGYEYPEGFEAYLAGSGVSGPEFRAALLHTTEVLYGRRTRARSRELLGDRREPGEGFGCKGLRLRLASNQTAFLAVRPTAPTLPRCCTRSGNSFETWHGHFGPCGTAGRNTSRG